jgi:predicted TIM-barrel fold metal-dependent hydrolase
LISTLFWVYGHLESLNYALVSPFESLFYKNNESANSYLHDIEGSRTLIPIAAVNPMLPDIQHYLKNLADQHMVRGLKLHPDYHNYRISENSAQPVFKAAEDMNLPVIVPIRIWDERHHHRLAMVPPTNVKELVEAAKLYPDVKIVVCNARSNEVTEVLQNGEKLGNLYAVVSWAQGEGFIASAVSRYGCSRLMWGSNMPLFYPETTLEQIKRAEIEIEEKNKILFENAQTVFNLKL